MNTSFTSPKSSRAFTRLELLAVLAALGLLASVAGPGLANNKPHSQRAVCVNNLRLIARAYQEWASEHGDVHPVRLPIRQSGGIYSMDGGTQGHPLDNNVWFQFSWVSNQLATPKILVCPSDTRPVRRAADNFGASTNGGFMSINYQNNAVSYFLSTHAFYNYPQSLLCGDYNVGGLTAGVSCSTGITTAYGAYPASAQWTNNIHGECGNIVLTDGQVRQLSTAGLRATFSDALAAGPYRALHFLFP